MAFVERMLEAIARRRGSSGTRHIGSGSECSGDAGLLGRRANGSAVRARAEDRPWECWCAKLRAAELRLGRRSAGGLVRSVRRSGRGAGRNFRYSRCAVWRAGPHSTARIPHATQQAFLEGARVGLRLVRWRIPGLRYDNLTSAVTKILRGHRREETARFVAFRSHWRSAGEFCTPGEAHEKGGIEAEAGYFRRNHWVPVPQGGGPGRLERATGDRLSSGRTPAPSRTGADGRRGAANRTAAASCHWHRKAGSGASSFPTVNGLGCVKVRTNTYSVPLAAGAQVQAKVYASVVEALA